MEKRKRKKAPRAMMGFPWPEASIVAFQQLAEMVPTGPAKGNASALARTILDQFMFAVLEPEQVQKLNLLDPWDAEEERIPAPSILRYAIRKYEEREAATVQGTPRKARHANGHAALPS